MLFSIIMLHGLGADGSDMQPLAAAWAARLKQAQPTCTCRIHCPDAPSRAVSVNGGYVMPAWFDIYALDAHAPVDSAGIAQSVQRIRTLLDSEHRAGVPWQNIFLGGFSQGGAIALHTLLQLEQTIGGVIALSTWLPMPPVPASFARTPVFIGHGVDDDLVPVAAAERAQTHLRALDYLTEFHTYPLAHSISMQEIDDIGAWLLQRTAQP